MGENVSAETYEERSPPTPDYNYYLDVENRITDVNDLTGTQVADYSYDALGRRNKKIVYDGGNSSITYYVYGSQGELVSLHLPRK